MGAVDAGWILRFLFSPTMIDLEPLTDGENFLGFLIGCAFVAFTVYLLATG